jgi:hypothetical protein
MFGEAFRESQDLVAPILGKGFRVLKNTLNNSRKLICQHRKLVNAQKGSARIFIEAVSGPQRF